VTQNPFAIDIVKLVVDKRDELFMIGMIEVVRCGIERPEPWPARISHSDLPPLK
jgi:hypothetical protein